MDPRAERIRISVQNLLIQHLFIIVRPHERHGVSNYQRLDSLFNGFVSAYITENTKAAHYWPLCEGNLRVIGGFPAEMASIAESVSISWRHKDHVPIVSNINSTYQSES